MKTRNVLIRIDFGIQSFFFVSMLLLTIASLSGIPFLILLPLLGIWQFSTSIFYGFFAESGYRKYYFPVAVLTLIGFYFAMKDNWHNFLINYEIALIIPFSISIWYYKITYDECNL